MKLVRTGVGIAVGAWASVVWGQASKPVDFVHRGGPAKAVFAELTAATGEPWLVSGALANEVLCIRANGASVVELRSRIAEAMRAEWQQESGGLRLIRSAALIRKWEQESMAARAKAIQEAFDKKRKELAALQPLDDQAIQRITAQVGELSRAGEDRQNWERLRKIQEEFPSHHAAFRILLLLDPRQIAAIRPNDRVVYSTHPTAAQRPLPRAAMDIVAAMTRDQSRLAESMGRVVDEEGPYAWMLHQLTQISAADQPAKALLIFNPADFGEGMQCELQVANGKGRYISTTRAQVLDHRWRDTEKLMQPAPPDPSQPAEEPFAQSEWQKRFGEFAKRSMESGEVVLPDELRAPFLQPEKTEPLQLVFGDYAVQLAERANKNLVAAPSDDAAFLFYFGTVEPLKPSRFRTIIGSGVMQSAIEESDRWITIRPLDFVAAREAYVDRALFGTIMRRLATGEPMGLDDWASIAAKYEDDLTRKPLAMMLMVLSSDRESIALGMNGSWQKMRFYGLLTPAQRQRFATGRPVPVSSLTPAQLQTLARLLFHEEPSLEPMQSTVEAPPEGVPEQTADSMGYNSLLSEVTERIPMGIPPASLVTLQLSEDQGFFVDYSYAGHKSTMYANMDSIAWHLYRLENPDPSDDSEGIMTYTAFQPAFQRNLQFTIQVARDAQKTFSLSDTQKRPNAKKVPYEQLPESVRAELKKKVEEIKKSNVPPDDDPPPLRRSRSV